MIWVNTLAGKLRRLGLVLIGGAGKRWPGIIVVTAREPWTFR
jgi:hypothetical protein